MRRLVRFLRRERGAAILEFALVAPIFFMLVLGIMMFSRAYQRLNALNVALREGARLAAVTQAPTQTLVRQRALQFSTSYGYPIDTTYVVLTPTTYTQATTQVTVSATNYPIFTGLNFLSVLQNIQVTRSATFRWEYGP